MEINQITAVIQYPLAGINLIFVYHLRIRLDNQMETNISASCRCQHRNQIHLLSKKLCFSQQFPLRIHNDHRFFCLRSGIDQGKNKTQCFHRSGISHNKTVYLTRVGINRIPLSEKNGAALRYRVRSPHNKPEQIFFSSFSVSVSLLCFRFSDNKCSASA